MTICFADKPLWIDEWRDISKHTVLHLHSCSAAEGTPVFMGDIGGIPGLVLGGKSQCLLAPVTEISMETAKTLHKYLIASDGPATMGQRYLQAIKEDPRVALYNLYGLADIEIASGEYRNS